MLFYTKELEASLDDEDAGHNPFIISKLDLKSIEAFNFDKFQGYIDIVNTPTQDPGSDESYSSAI